MPRSEKENWQEKTLGIIITKIYGKFFAKNIICSKNNTIKNTRHNYYVLKQIHFLFICKHFIILNTYKVARQIKLEIKNKK